MYQYQSETKRQRTAYTRYQALELEKVPRKLHSSLWWFRPSPVLVPVSLWC